MARMRRDANANLSDGERLQLPEDKSNRAKRHSHEPIELELARRFVTPTISNLDRYRRGSAELHVHFGIRSEGHGNLELDFCAVSKKLIWPQPCGTAHDSLTRCGNDDHGLFQARADRNEFTMLISVLQATDDVQDVLVGTMRQLIRLRTYDECLGLQWKSSDGSQETFPSFRVTNDVSSLGIPGPQILRGDWEPSILALAARTSSGHDDMIECASQVVYEVAQHDGNHRIRLLNDVESVSLDVVIALWLPDGDGPVRVGASVPLGFTTDVYHVVLRPLELEPPGVGHDV